MTDSSSDRPNGDGAFLPPDWTELEPLLDELLDVPVEQRAARIVELSRVSLRGSARWSSCSPTPNATRRCSTTRPRVASTSSRRDPAVTCPSCWLGAIAWGGSSGAAGWRRCISRHDLKHGRDVAVKVIRQDLSASLGHDRFLREIEIAARLRHPNIVPLYDSGEVDGSLFFVMPYEEGQSLRERLRQDGALPITDALSVLRDVARALCYAHEHGVVHRDIKPDNVMLSGGAAVVTDFGIAKAVSVALTDAPDATLTQAGTVIGTPAYMAPEQATGDPAIDHRADIYSFGCLGYELFAGHPPFREQSSHLLIAAHIATVPRPVTELRGDVPQSVADLLAPCLAKDPADRPQSARELLPVLDGATGVSSSSPAQRPRARGWGRPRIAAAVTVFAAAAAITGYCGTRTAGVAAPITLAVLPFANIAGDTAMNYVADGLFDEVASALGRVPGILIKSRSGARAYRGQLAPDVTEAGARLKADYILTGAVRQDRGRWVLSADLERAADASSVWDQAFKIDPNEQAAAADSIAGNLSAELRRLFPRVIGVAPVRPPAQRTSNDEAYRLYLRGQEKLARRGQSVKEAVELFRQAIKEDSLFAPAYSGLSMALALSPWFHRVPPADVHDEIVAAARRALALDPTLSLPHVALGLAHWQAYAWVRAATEMETAFAWTPATSRPASSTAIPSKHWSYRRRDGSTR